jgi:hypothetical protein
MGGRGNPFGVASNGPDATPLGRDDPAAFIFGVS